jgi:hypothetical protein
VRVLYDSNLYLEDRVPLAAGQSSPALPFREAATAVDAMAAMGVKWRAKSGATADLGYAPEVVRYLEHASESHLDHVLTANLSASAGAWSTDWKTRYLYVDGSNDSPIFSGLGGTPAIGGEPVRARRTQAIARVAGKITRQSGRGFVRGVFSSFDQQFHTRELNAAGYCNYADRDESSVGLDAGYRPADRIAFVVAERTGFQRQANVLGVPLNYSNTFTRWLVGVEGTLLRSLKLTLLAGPDLRHYGESVRTGFAREQRTGYAELSAMWTPTKTDSVALTAKHYLWFSSAGRGAYADTVADLAYKRVLGPTWNIGAAANFHEGNTSHFNPWSPRRDRIYTGTLTLGHSLGAKTRVEAEVMHDWSGSLVPNTPAREYSRWITSVSLVRSW